MDWERRTRLETSEVRRSGKPKIAKVLSPAEEERRAAVERDRGLSKAEKRRRKTGAQLMAARRRAERKAGIVRSATAKAVPFSTKLEREGFPHGKTAASIRSVERAQ